MSKIRRPGALLGALAIAMAATLVTVPARAAGGPVPAGYRVVGREALGPGIEHLTLHQDQPPQTVHVARLAPGVASRLRPVLSSDVMTGPAAGPETTSSMCARVRCIVAVNGDFAGPGGALVGAMIARGELVTSTGIPVWQLNFDRAGRATVSDGLLHAGVQVNTADGQGLAMQRVNRPLVGENISLYSRRWGPSTLTDAGAVEVVLGLASTDVLPAGVTPVRTVSLRAGGNSPIGPGQVVLAGRGAGAQALTALAQRAPAGAELVVQTAAAQSIGAAPHLLSGGRLAFAPDEAGSFMQGHHPRTMFGVTPAGEALLVTVDGRQSDSTGMSLGEAAGFMAALGASDAVNFDGGGSTTFVTGGGVRNQPSEGAERRVVSALAVVPPGDAAPAPAAPPAGPRTTPTDPASLIPDLLNALLQPLLDQLAGQPPP